MRIFVSYAHADAQTFAAEVSSLLETSGHQVWLDRQGGIRTGESWDESVESGLKNAQAVVAILTPAAVRPDGFCRNEISYSLDMKKLVIPIKCLECTTPIQMYRIQHIDYLHKGSPSLHELTDRLREGNKAPDRPPGKTHILDFSADLARLARDIVPRPWLSTLVEEVPSSQHRRGILITAPSGWGKTSFLALLAKSYPQVGAVHLFKSTDQRTLEPHAFLRSIAAQISERIPAFAPPLLQTQQHMERSPAELAQDMIIEPFISIGDKTAIPETWIILDAVDEVATESASGILDVLTLLADQLPDGLSMVVGSRPNDRIERLFVDLQLVPLKEHGDKVDDDIVLFLSSKVEIVGFAREIANHAEGNYLVAQAAAKEIAREGATLEDVAKVPPQMELRYLAIFKEQFPDAREYRRTAEPILGLIAAAKQPLSIQTIARFLSKDPTQVADVLRPLRSLIPITDGLATIVQRTLREWLIDLSLADEYAVSMSRAESMLAEACRAWEQLLQDNESYALRWGPVHALHTNRRGVMRSYVLDSDYAAAYKEAFGSEDWSLLLATLADAAGPGFLAELAESIDDAHNPQVASDLGLMAYRRNQFDDARRLFDAAAKFAVEVENWDLVAETYARRGWVESAEGRRSVAEGFYRKCRDVALEHHSDYGMLIAYRHFARMFERQNQLAKAEKAYKEAVSLANKLGQPRLLIGSYCGLGDLLTRQERWDDALVVLEIAIDLAGRQNSAYHVMVANSLWARAALGSPRISVEKVMQSLEISLAIAERRVSERGVGEVSFTRGILAAQEERWAEAALHLTAATRTLWLAGARFVMGPLEALVGLPDCDALFEGVVRDVLEQAAAGSDLSIPEVIRSAERESAVISSGLTLIAKRPIPKAHELLNRGAAVVQDCLGIEVAWRKEENLHLTIIPVKRRNPWSSSWPPPLTVIRALASVSPEIDVIAREAFVTQLGAVVLVVMPNDNSLATLRTGLKLLIPEIDDTALPYFPHVTLGRVSAIENKGAFAAFRAKIPQAFEDLDMELTISGVSLVNYQTRNLDIVKGVVTWPLGSAVKEGNADKRSDDEIAAALVLRSGPAHSLLGGC